MKVRRVRVDLDRAQVLSVGISYAAPDVYETGRRVLNRAKLTSPVDTGNMRSKHRLTMRARRTFVEGRITVNTRYARLVHNGTRQHVIVPRKKKALRFTHNGKTVIVRRVYHPGTKARPWLFAALEEIGHLRGYRVTHPIGR